MKKLILTLACAAAALGLHAQMADVSAPVRVFPGSDEGMYHPVMWADGNTVTVSDPDYTNARTVDLSGRTYSASDVTATSLAASTSCFTAGATRVLTRGNELEIIVNGERACYTPVESFAGYLWPSVSPDGTKVMFFAAGEGIVVCDLQGNVLSRPGNFEAPVWYGNGHILAQNATDDGHQFESSQIVLLSVDGRQRQDLTAPESMAFTPAGNLDTNTVVYSTVDGILYKMNVYIR